MKTLFCFSVSLAGLVQRCVIIQKDENGFGLTVSGDNPVFVQLVKEGKLGGVSNLKREEEKDVVTITTSGLSNYNRDMGSFSSCADIKLSW